MVIFIAGLVGTGKTSLSKALSEQLSVFHYDVDEIKKQIYPTDPNYASNMEKGIHFCDETRTKVFHRVVEDFPKLAQQHKHIIVEEVLSKNSLRNILFEGAKKYFKNYLIIWVKADEENIKKRLEEKPRTNHILKKPFNVYLSLKKEFEDLPEADIVFENNAPLTTVTLEKLTQLIRNKLR